MRHAFCGAKACFTGGSAVFSQARGLVPAQRHHRAVRDFKPNFPGNSTIQNRKKSGQETSNS